MVGQQQRLLSQGQQQWRRYLLQPQLVAAAAVLLLLLDFSTFPFLLLRGSSSSGNLPSLPLPLTHILLVNAAPSHLRGEDTEHTGSSSSNSSSSNSSSSNSSSSNSSNSSSSSQSSTSGSGGDDEKNGNLQEAAATAAGAAEQTAGYSVLTHTDAAAAAAAAAAALAAEAGDAIGAGEYTDEAPTSTAGTADAAGAAAGPPPGDDGPLLGRRGSTGPVPEASAPESPEDRIETGWEPPDVPGGPPSTPEGPPEAPDDLVPRLIRRPYSERRDAYLKVPQSFLAPTVATEGRPQPMTDAQIDAEIEKLFSVRPEEIDKQSAAIARSVDASRTPERPNGKILVAIADLQSHAWDLQQLLLQHQRQAEMEVGYEDAASSSSSSSGVRDGSQQHRQPSHLRSATRAEAERIGRTALRSQDFGLQQVITTFKVLPEVGMAVLDFNPQSSQAEIREAVQSIWLRSPSAWLIEADSEVTIRETVGAEQADYAPDYEDGDGFEEETPYYGSTGSDAASAPPSYRTPPVPTNTGSSSSRLAEALPEQRYKQDEAATLAAADAGTQRTGTDGSGGAAARPAAKSQQPLQQQQQRQQQQRQQQQDRAEKVAARRQKQKEIKALQTPETLQAKKAATERHGQSGSSRQQPLPHHDQASPAASTQQQQRASAAAAAAAAEKKQTAKLPREQQQHKDQRLKAQQQQQERQQQQTLNKSKLQDLRTPKGLKGQKVRAQQSGESTDSPAVSPPIGLLSPEPLTETYIQQLQLPETIVATPEQFAGSHLRRLSDTAAAAAAAAAAAGKGLTPETSPGLTESGEENLLGSEEATPAVSKQPEDVGTSSTTAAAVAAASEKRTAAAVSAGSESTLGDRSSPSSASGDPQRQEEAETLRREAFLEFEGVTPNDLFYNRQWALTHPKFGCNIGKAWRLAYDAKRQRRSSPGGDSAAASAGEAAREIRARQEMIVAVIDTGVDLSHEDLKNKLWKNAREIPGNGIDDDGNGYVDDYHGYDFEKGLADPSDDHGHGTHVAGIIAAAANNGIGIAGVNWRVKVMPLKFEKRSSAAVEAIAYSIQMGARISTNSWGFSFRSEALRLALKQAETSGQLFIAAVDNASQDNTTAKDFPPNWGYDWRTGVGFKNILRVANLAITGTLASASNFGRYNVDIAAPGTDIISTLPSRQFGDKYGFKSGTSMATPLVAGVAAMIWGERPSLAAWEVRDILMATAAPLPSLRTAVISGGTVDCAAAVRLVQALNQRDRGGADPPEATAFASWQAEQQRLHQQVLAAAQPTQNPGHSTHSPTNTTKGPPVDPPLPQPAGNKAPSPAERLPVSSSAYYNYGSGWPFVVPRPFSQPVLSPVSSSASEHQLPPQALFTPPQAAPIPWALLPSALSPQPNTLSPSYNSKGGYYHENGAANPSSMLSTLAGLLQPLSLLCRFVARAPPQLAKEGPV